MKVFPPIRFTSRGEKQSGYYIPGECLMRIREENIIAKIAEQLDFDIPETQNERIVYLTFNMLFGNRYSQEDMEELFFLSPSVVYGDIKALEKWLKGRRISMELRKADGKYYLKEEESVIRSLISGIYTQRNNMVMELKYSYFISGSSEFYETVNELIECVVEFLNEEHLQLSGRSILSFAVDIALAYYRTSQEFYIQSLSETMELSVRLKEKLLRHDNRFAVLRDEDYGYLLERLRGKDYLSGNPLLSVSNEVRAAVRDFSEAIAKYGKTLSDERNLMSETESILYIKRHRFYYSISRRRRIFENNTEMLYLAVLYTYYCHRYFPEDVFTVHDLARLTVCLKHSISSEKKHLLLVCDSSRYTAEGLKESLERYFADRITVDAIASSYDYRRKKGTADGIISTVPLNETDLPYLEINLISAKDQIGKVEEFLTGLDRSEVVSAGKEAIGNSLEEVLRNLLRELRGESEVSSDDWEYILEDIFRSSVIKGNGRELNVMIPLLHSDCIRRYDLSFAGEYHETPYTSVTLFVLAEETGMIRECLL